MSEMIIHPMTLQSDGSYLCEVCGRHLIFDPIKSPCLTVISAGDPTISHTGGNGLVMSAEVKDPRMEVFDKWLEDRQK